SCVDNFGNADGTPSANGVTNLKLASGGVVICNVTNNQVIGASLHIDKQASVSTYKAVGDEIDYNYTVTNDGNVTVTGIGVNDDKICPTSASCITCNATTLAPNASTTCGPAKYFVTQADLDNGSVTNSALAK